MRLIELTLSILTFLSAILFLLPRISTRVKYHALPLLLIVTAVAQIWREGLRWQLWPLVIAIAALLFLALRGILNPDHKKRRTGILIAALVLTFLSLAAGVLLPIPQPFTITGPYQVGTTVFPLVDPSREEIYADLPNQPREIMVQVWYPAEPKESDQQSQWMPDIRGSWSGNCRVDQSALLCAQPSGICPGECLSGRANCIRRSKIPPARLFSRLVRVQGAEYLPGGRTRLPRLRGSGGQPHLWRRGDRLPGWQPALPQ